MEGNVYRGEERAKSFGSALTHFLRGSVKRAHFATAKLISPFPPRDSLPFFPFSSSLFPFSSPFFGRHNGRTNGRKSMTGEKVFANFGADFYDTRDDRATRKPSDAAFSFSSCSFLLIKVLIIFNRPTFDSLIQLRGKYVYFASLSSSNRGKTFHPSQAFLISAPFKKHR